MQVQVQVSTSDKTEAKCFYEPLRQLERYTRRGEITTVIGDLNAKIGED